MQQEVKMTLNDSTMKDKAMKDELSWDEFIWGIAGRLRTTENDLDEIENEYDNDEKGLRRV